MGESRGWINQNTQQPLDKAESQKSSGNVKSKPASEINNNEDSDEMKTQLKLWRDAEKKEPWHDAPPKVKVKKGNYRKREVDNMVIEFTIGLPPQAAYDLLTNPDNNPFSRTINGFKLLKNISRKVMSKDDGFLGPLVEVETALSWNFLLWSGTIPLDLQVAKNPNKHSVEYLMKKGNKLVRAVVAEYKVEPIYIDSKRLCKHIEPKSGEEYEKCSGGQGRIASKVKMEQHVMPSSPFDMAPLSYFFRRIALNTTITLIEHFQTQGAIIRGA